MNELKIKKLGIIAGEGYLPRHVYDACVNRGIDCEVIALEKETSFELFEDVEVKKFKIHKISNILKSMKNDGVTHVTLAGKVKRADLSRLLLDLKGAKLFAKILKSGLNDNSILVTIVKFIETEGFEIVAPEKIATDIIIGKGLLTKAKLDKNSTDDIKRGIKVLKGIAGFDVGQALVIQNGLVLGVEAAEGTDLLIKRCGEIRQKDSDGPVLVKICKPDQDKRVDLPCIGPKSIENAHKFGLKGIAIEAGASLILDQKNTVALADKLGVFIYGI
jgi:DUF1009 family protein